MQERLLNLVSVVVMLCALVTTGLVVRREFFSPPLAASAPAPREVPEWRTYAEGHRMGPANAPVTIVEFSDFQCPACRLAAGRLRELRARYPERVAVVYRHFPLPSHAAALPAARASECAAAQGAFEAFHDALFAEQDSIGRVPWTRFAARAGVRDVPAFERCMADAGATPAVERDTRVGRSVGIAATPTILVNDLMIQGSPSAAYLEELVAQAERRAK